MNSSPKPQTTTFLPSFVYSNEVMASCGSETDNIWKSSEFAASAAQYLHSKSYSLLQKRCSNFVGLFVSRYLI